MSIATSNIIPGKTYDTEKCVYLTCAPQAQFYLQNKGELVDLLYEGTRTNRLVFVFEKNQLTRELYEQWKASKPEE